MERTHYLKQFIWHLRWDLLALMAGALLLFQVTPWDIKTELIWGVTCFCLVGLSKKRFDQYLQQNQQMSHCAVVRAACDIQDIIAMTDPNGVIISVNENFCRISGYAKEELVGQKHSILKSGRHAPVFYENMWKTLTSGAPWRGTICNRAKDGTFYWVDTVIVPQVDRNSKQVTAFLSIRHDVTRIVNYAEEARRHHAHYEALFTDSPIGVVETDANDIIVLANASFCRLIGYEPAQIVGRQLSEFNADSNSNYIPNHVVEDLDGQDTKREPNFEAHRKRYRHRNREAIWVRENSNTTLNGGTIYCVENIQPLIEKEKALANYFEQFEKIFMNSTDLVVTIDAQGRLIQANESYRKFQAKSSATEERLLLVVESVHEEDRSQFQQNCQFIQTGRSCQWESRMVSDTGKTRSVLWRGVGDRQNGHTYLIGRDISEFRQKETLSRLSEKQASLSQISAGVAHEINNPLTIIRGRIELIKKVLGREQPDFAKIQRYLENADEMVSRIVHVTEALRIFSQCTGRPDGHNVEENWCGLLLESAIRPLSDILEKHKIRLGIHVCDDDFKFFCRAREFQQVIQILLLNSVEAIEKQFDPWVTIEAKKQNNQAIIVIRDSGPGLSREIRGRVMDPFFSTKPMGLGLGLSIASGLMASIGGSIDFDVHEMHTNFQLRFPEMLEVKLDKAI